MVIDRKNLLGGDPSSFVYVAENGVAKKRMVEPGITSGVFVEIEKGLSAGDRLIVEGQLLLEDGKKNKNCKLKFNQLFHGRSRCLRESHTQITKAQKDDKCSYPIYP